VELVRTSKGLILAEDWFKLEEKRINSKGGFAVIKEGTDEGQNKGKICLMVDDRDMIAQDDFKDHISPYTIAKGKD